MFFAVLYSPFPPYPQSTHSNALSSRLCRAFSSNLPAGTIVSTEDHAIDGVEVTIADDERGQAETREASTEV